MVAVGTETGGRPGSDTNRKHLEKKSGNKTRADSVRTQGVRTDIAILNRIEQFMAILIAVAGIVTPFGLYEALVPSGQVLDHFQYVADSSPFGYGTPPRSNYSFNRQCGLDYLVPCPFSNTIAVVIEDGENGTIEFHHGYDIDIPPVIWEIHSSGVDNSSTVSNYFDIQWRNYALTTDPRLNNGSTWLDGSFRPMESLVLTNPTQPVEGLIVDMMNGRVGLRNQTIPTGIESGAT